VIGTRGDGKSLHLLRMGRQLSKPWLTFRSILELYARAVATPREAKYLTPERLRKCGWRFR